MLKRLFTLGTLLCWAALAPASYELDRAAQALDRGQSAKARFLYGRILDVDPCDSAAQAGLIRAQGDPSPYRSQCPPEPLASPLPGALAQPGPATPEALATPAAAATVATAPSSPLAAAGETQQPTGVNDLGVQPQRHRQGGEAPPRPGWHWAQWGGLGVLVAGLALAMVVVARRWRAVVQSAPATEGGAAPEATPAAPDDVPRPAEIPLAAPPTPVLAAALQPLGPRALPPEQSVTAPAAWASPLAPGEAVIARLDGAQGQAGLTAHQFYFQGPRGVKEGWFRRQETLTLAVPLHQVTGLGWAQRGGERLIVGTALAGDIALSASDFGALALRQFAQALAVALERPLA